MAKYINTIGVKEGIGADGSVPLRLEIYELQKNKDLLNLYLLGLQRMQDAKVRPKTDPLSWYQLAGIHGRPFTPWDGVQGNSRNFGGYCTHSSILFLPWHRPYLAVFEQSLHENVKAAVAAFPPGPTKDKYARLVPTFRMPYWDWAANPVLPDLILNQKEVDVITPSGPAKIKNPLFSYNFESINLNDFPPDRRSGYSTWLNTLRYPDSQDSARPRAPAPNDQSRTEALKKALKDIDTIPSFPSGRPLLNIRDRIFSLFSKNNYKNFQYVSNTGWNNNGSVDDYDSLEGVHDTMHSILGGNGGHMTSPGFAAFDPIFWLHHTNVDRLFAIWQVLNPDSYVVPQRPANDTFWSATDRGGVYKETSTTGLVPFHKDQTTFWTSDDVRNVKTFGSTYPELVDWGSVSAAQQKLNVQTAVSKLYGRTAPVSRVAGTTIGRPSPSVPAPPVPFNAPSVAMKTSIPQTDGANDDCEPKDADIAGEPREEIEIVGDGQRDHTHLKPSAELSGLIDDGSYHEYFCNIRAEKYALGGAFLVHVFLGDFTTDPALRGEDDSLVGTFSVFADDLETTGCEKCVKDAEEKLIVSASIPLTGALLDRIADHGEGIVSLEPEHVTPYLRRHLHWRINMIDGSAVSRASVPSLKVVVASVIVDIPTTQMGLPVYGEWEPVYGVTIDRPAGIVQGDAL